MSEIWRKIDPGLARVYARYLSGEEEFRRVVVSVYFTSGLDDLESLGFEPVRREDENRVTGAIDLAGLESFAAHEGVEEIVFGETLHPMLEVSVHDVRADEVWSVSGGTFSGGTGAGAMIGVIDSGIQRAGMPRIVEGHTGRPDRIEPRTALLREGLDSGRSYFLHEEEVPRAGARVAQSFQRTRWRDGRVVVWLGASKRVAQGEASSGLAFDQLVDVRPAPE